jgi:large subunit ribosomal protein L24
MKVKKGDTVIVTAGKDKGKEGVITRAFPKTNQVLMEGINVVKRHQKAARKGSQGQIVAKPMPFSVSNVALKDPKSGKAVRVGYKMEGEGDKAKKVRVARPSGLTI